MDKYKRRKARQQIGCNRCTDGRQGNSLKVLYGRSSVVSKLRLMRLSEREQVKEIVGQ